MERDEGAKTEVSPSFERQSFFLWRNGGERERAAFPACAVAGHSWVPQCAHGDEHGSAVSDGRCAAGLP